MPANARHAIENLLYNYAKAIDAGDFGAVAKLFASACIIGPDGAEIARGEEQTRKLYEYSTRIYETSGTPCTQHITSNVIVDLNDDLTLATSHSRFVVYQQLEDFPLQAIITGTYIDEFAKSQGHWHFIKRQMLPTLIGDLSRHLLTKP